MGEIRTCDRCIHEYCEEPDDCTDCFDTITEGENAIRKNYKLSKIKKKRVGEYITCPVCEGSGAVLVYTFPEMKELCQISQGKLKGYINIDNQRFKVYLHLEPVEKVNE